MMGWLLRKRAKAWLRDIEANLGIVVENKDDFARIANEWVGPQTPRSLLARDYTRSGPVFEALINALAIHASTRRGQVIVINEEHLATNLLVADRTVGANPWTSLALLTVICSKDTCDKFIESAKQGRAGTEAHPSYH